MKKRTVVQVGVPLLLALALFMIFPATLRFVQGAALSAVRFWWLILGLGLLAWLIWMLNQRNPRP